METKNRRKLGKTVFVTVGTTQFDKLIQTMCEERTLEALVMLGYNQVVMQIGAGSQTVLDSLVPCSGLTVHHYRFKPSIRQDIEAADLVISHAGAGSCLETLGAGKKLLVVINDELMDNHQLELAYQLSNDGHLHYCTCSTLIETLKEKSFEGLKPFERGRPELFAEYLDNLMGFS